MFVKQKTPKQIRFALLHKSLSISAVSLLRNRVFSLSLRKVIVLAALYYSQWDRWWGWVCYLLMHSEYTSSLQWDGRTVDSFLKMFLRCNLGKSSIFHGPFSSQIWTSHITAMKTFNISNKKKFLIIRGPAVCYMCSSSFHNTVTSPLFAFVCLSLNITRNVL